MGRRIGRAEPYPCCGLRDLHVLLSAEIQHTVQHVGFGSVPKRGSVPTFAIILIGKRSCQWMECHFGAETHLASLLRRYRVHKA